jgi:dihydroorotate dehydrogenase electron transfer subunit
LSAYRIAANQLRTTHIATVRVESPTVKSFAFKDKECAKARPGQFLMLWVPGVDEIPLSILDAKKDGTVAVAVKKVGEATKALHNMKSSEVVGVRGPFGNNFTERKGGVLMVGGGTGTAPLLFLTKRLMPNVSRIVFVQGAKTKDELLFMDEFERTIVEKRGQFITTTEDGSCGVIGLCTTPLEQLLAKEKFDVVYACGPEPMMLKVLQLADKHHLELEASLERLMRCAVGLCGSCVIGKYRVCRDGPVFTLGQLKKAGREFGVSKRDFDGRKIPV